MSCCKYYGDDDDDDIHIVIHLFYDEFIDVVLAIAETAVWESKRLWIFVRKEAAQK